MTPQRAIAMLDDFLRKRGQDVVLRRMQLVGGAQSVAASVTCRAHDRGLGRGYQANQLVGNLTQQDNVLIMSPSEIIAAGWTSGRAAGEDQRVPLRGNQVVVAGQVRSVESVNAIYMAGELVRIELQHSG